MITGAFDGGRDQYWFRKHLPADGSVTFTDRRQALCTIGVWGPNAAATWRQIVAERSTPAPCRHLPGGLPVRLGA